MRESSREARLGAAGAVAPDDSEAANVVWRPIAICARFDAATAKCYREGDRQRLLAVARPQL